MFFYSCPELRRDIRRTHYISLYKDHQSCQGSRKCLPESSSEISQQQTQNQFSSGRSEIFFSLSKIRIL